MELLAKGKGYKIFTLKHGEKSPLEDHDELEIGHDEKGNFYVYEVLLNTYGTDAIIEGIKSNAQKG